MTTNLPWSGLRLRFPCRLGRRGHEPYSGLSRAPLRPAEIGLFLCPASVFGCSRMWFCADSTPEERTQKLRYFFDMCMTSFCREITLPSNRMKRAKIFICLRVSVVSSVSHSFNEWIWFIEWKKQNTYHLWTSFVVKKKKKRKKF